MSQTINGPFSIILNTNDTNCKRIGLSSFIYYLKEPIQLFNMKFECKVQAISMPKKAKPFEFSVCKQSDLDLDSSELELTAHKFVSTSYEGVAEILTGIFQNNKLNFMYKDKKFIIQNSEKKRIFILFCRFY